MNDDDSYNFTADNEDVLKDIDKILERITGTPPQTANGYSDTIRQDENMPLATPDMLMRSEIPSVTQALMTQVIDQKDITTTSSKFCTAKEEEVNGLQKRETWQVIPKASLPHKANVLSGRFVLTLKNLGSADEKPKARYVSQGNCDREKAHMVHNITTLRQISTRIIVSVSVIKGFRLFSHDVRQA